VVESTKNLHFQMQMKTAITMDEGVAMPHPIYNSLLFLFLFSVNDQNQNFKNVKNKFKKKKRGIFVCFYGCDG